MVDDASPLPLELHPDHAGSCRVVRRDECGGPAAARASGLSALGSSVSLGRALRRRRRLAPRQARPPGRGARGRARRRRLLRPRVDRRLRRPAHRRALDRAAPRIARGRRAHHPALQGQPNPDLEHDAPPLRDRCGRRLHLPRASSRGLGPLAAVGRRRRSLRLPRRDARPLPPPPRRPDRRRRGPRPLPARTAPSPRRPRQRLRPRVSPSRRHRRPALRPAPRPASARARSATPTAADDGAATAAEAGSG